MVNDHVNSTGHNARRNGGSHQYGSANLGSQPRLPLRSGSKPDTKMSRGQQNRWPRAQRPERKYNLHGHKEFLEWLFLEQHRLTKSVRRQARLAKLTVPEVKSVDSELLRRVTNDIIRVSADLAATVAPDRYNRSEILREVTDPQAVLEGMLQRQGIKFLGVGAPEQVKPAQVLFRGPLNRTPGHGGHSVRGSDSQFGVLGGPALRYYLNAVRRGYRGGPQSWLWSRYSRQVVPVLARRGLIGPLEKRDFCVFSEKSPLRFVLSTNTKLQSDVRLGFQGERLTPYGDYSVMCRQKAGPKLAQSQWPSYNGHRLWPSTPTLGESWEMLWRGVPPRQSVEFEQSNDCSTLEQVQQNAELARKIVRENLLGVRAWVSIPEKFRWYFKYRWGFLILRTRVRLPIGLVRFLLVLWSRAPNQCFTLVPVTFRYYLKHHIKAQWITELSWSDRQLRTFLSKLPAPRRDGEPESFRPSEPIHFLRESTLDAKLLTKVPQRVRLR